ncbi:MAG: site-specific DNA-methyltransferase [Nitrospirae bacterium]|nr:site-specific DNA-methyltransferase [Nitrospirota bacterium]
MNEIQVHKDEIPATIEELKDFILIGTERLKAYRARLNAVKKLSLAKNIVEQALEDAQNVATALLFAESRLGGLISNIEKEPGKRNDLLPSTNRGTSLQDIGIGYKEQHFAQLLHENQNTMKGVINFSKQNGTIPTKYEVLKRVKEIERQNVIHKYRRAAMDEAASAIPDNSSPISDFLDKVFMSDIREVLKNLPDKSVDMIFTDADYNLPGTNYAGRRFTSDFSDYMKWYILLAQELFRVLKDDGNMFFINYARQNALLWGKYLDDVCYDVQEYVWCYNTDTGRHNKHFTKAHRSILHATKSENNRWYNYEVLEPYTHVDNVGVKRRMEAGFGNGRAPYSWFNLGTCNNIPNETKIHPCVLPEAIVDKFIRASTVAGNVILIPFGGAGTEILASKRLDRHFISAEIVDVYHGLIMQRLRDFDASQD